MKFVLIILVAVFELTTGISVPKDNSAATSRIANKTTQLQPRAILSENGKNIVENFINHLPCGWPKAGIPPLAPYAKKLVDLEYNNSFVELSQKLEYFRIDGLDIMLIERLKVGYTFSKYVKFNLVYPKIIISGKYITQFFIDLMKEYGISVSFDGKGDFELMVEDIVINGAFKYKMPLLTGHTMIYKFNVSVFMGNIVSKIGGIGGKGKLNRLFNEKIEEIVLHLINFNQYEISKKLEEVLVPFINDKLKGRNMWTFIGSLFGQKGKICYPPPFPW